MRLNSLRLFAVRQLTCVIVFAAALCMPAMAQQTGKSVARQWMDLTIECIRLDYARPTITARNLFHVSEPDATIKFFIICNSKDPPPCGFFFFCELVVLPAWTPELFAAHSRKANLLFTRTPVALPPVGKCAVKKCWRCQWRLRSL